MKVHKHNTPFMIGNKTFSGKTKRLHLRSNEYKLLRAQNPEDGEDDGYDTSDHDSFSSCLYFINTV